MKLKIVFFYCLAYIFGLSSAYNILVALVAGTKSHMNFFNGINEALLHKGHNITFVTCHKSSVKHPNLREVLIEEDLIDKMSSNLFNTSIVSFMINLHFEFTPKICPRNIVNPEVQTVLKDDYDAVMLSLFFADCYLSVAFQKKIPFIYLNPNILMEPYSEKVGVMEFVSVSPGKAYPVTHPMTFIERTVIALAYSFMSLLNKFTILDRIDKNCRDQNVCPPDMPHIRDFERNSSLTIINGIRTLEQPVKQTPPNIIYAGGIHIKPNRTLPQDLQEWMDESGEHGVILFSLGTAVKSSMMDKRHFQILLNVFKSIEQRVLWKWDEDVDDLPANVRVSSWIPQQDVLAHPKTRLFITHGGLFSTQEAVYYEVPVIGMPVFADQQTNVADVVNEGWGRVVKWDDLTEENLNAEITFVLTDQKLHKTIQHRSKIMKDRPQTPSEEVSYWIEYVIRHKGAFHLRSPFLDMSWYQIYNVDVWSFVLLVVICSLLATLLLLKKIVSFITNKFLKIKIE